jgi:hypothetical protein
MKTSRLLATAFSMSIFISCPAYSQPLLVQEKPAAVLARLLEQSGYTYTKAAESVWTIAFKGKALPQFTLVATAHEDMAVLFVILAKKTELKLSPELMIKLLKLNVDLDRVKIGLDDDGDANVRVDLSIRRLDLAELKANIEQLSGAADEVYAAIKPYLTAPK